MDDIYLENVTIKFKNNLIIDNVNVNFYRNQVTALVGESGSGKSVLGMSILKLLPKYAGIEGECYLGNKDLWSYSSDINAIRGSEIGLILQNAGEALNSIIKIRKQGCEPLRIKREIDNTEAHEILTELLSKLGFSDVERIMGSYPCELSGGMNQRVLIGMGLAYGPKWIIVDEPTKGLDAVLRKKTYALFDFIKKDFQSSMIIITHDLELAEILSDRVVVMYKGKIVEQGRTEDVFTNPKHPYTQGLLKALPKRGMKPILKCNNERVSGCLFYNYCPFIKKKCREKIPNLIKIGDTAEVSCFLYDKD